MDVENVQWWMGQIKTILVRACTQIAYREALTR